MTANSVECGGDLVFGNTSSKSSVTGDFWLEIPLSYIKFSTILPSLDVPYLSLVNTELEMGIQT